MNSRLDGIKDWDERMARAAYHVGYLARNCGISERELRAYIQARFKIAPHVWIRARRLKSRVARQLLLRASTGRIKAVAIALGYKDYSNFSRDFKAVYGQSPKQWQRRR